MGGRRTVHRQRLAFQPCGKPGRAVEEVLQRRAGEGLLQGDARGLQRLKAAACAQGRLPVRRVEGEQPWQHDQLLLQHGQHIPGPERLLLAAPAVDVHAVADVQASGRPDPLAALQHQVMGAHVGLAADQLVVRGGADGERHVVRHGTAGEGAAGSAARGGVQRPLLLLRANAQRHGRMHVQQRLSLPSGSAGRNGRQPPACLRPQDSEPGLPLLLIHEHKAALGQIGQSQKAACVRAEQKQLHGLVLPCGERQLTVKVVDLTSMPSQYNSTV